MSVVGGADLVGWELFGHSKFMLCPIHMFVFVDEMINDYACKRSQSV